VLQFSVILLWFASLRPSGLCLDLSAISLPQWLAFLLLACYGQSLNVGIFQVACSCCLFCALLATAFITSPSP
jgi:hypothetical protein